MINKVLALFNQYARHHSTCTWWNDAGLEPCERDCSCGLRAAREALAEEPSKPAGLETERVRQFEMWWRQELTYGNKDALARAWAAGWSAAFLNPVGNPTSIPSGLIAKEEAARMGDAMRIVEREDAYVADESKRRFDGHSTWIPIDIEEWKILSAAIRSISGHGAQPNMVPREIGGIPDRGNS